jgi:hypothetical protein
LEKRFRTELTIHSDIIADQPHWLVLKVAPAHHHGSLQPQHDLLCQRLEIPNHSPGVRELARAKENTKNQVDWKLTEYFAAHSAVIHSKTSLIGRVMRSPYISTWEAGHALHMEVRWYQL